MRIKLQGMVNWGIWVRFLAQGSNNKQPHAWNEPWLSEWHADTQTIGLLLPHIVSWNDVTVLNNTALVITWSCLCIILVSSFFKSLNKCIPIYATSTLMTDTLHFVTHTVAVLNNCWSELMVYIVLAYSYLVSFYDVHQC